MNAGLFRYVNRLDDKGLRDEKTEGCWNVETASFRSLGFTVGTVENLKLGHPANLLLVWCDRIVWQSKKGPHQFVQRFNPLLHRSLRPIGLPA